MALIKKVSRKFRSFVIKERARSQWLSILGNVDLDDEFKIHDSRFVPRADLIDGVAYSVCYYLPFDKIPKSLLEVVISRWDKIENSLGGEGVLRSVLLYRNIHVPDQQRSGEIFSEAWHRDTIGVPNVQLFVLLNDTTMEDGALRYIDEKNMPYALKKFPEINNSKKRSLNNKVDNELFKYFEGKRGKYLLLNTYSHFHSAMIPQKGKHRDMASLAFEPAKLTSWENTIGKNEIKNLLESKVDSLHL